HHLLGADYALPNAPGQHGPLRRARPSARRRGGEHRKDKGVAILDYALGNRPSTGGEVGGRLCPPTRPAPVGSRRGGNPESRTDRHNRRKKKPVRRGDLLTAAATLHVQEVIGSPHQWESAGMAGSRWNFGMLLAQGAAAT